VIFLEINERIDAAVSWLLNSGIQNTQGENVGGIHGYYTGSGYPYIYSEITGYGISTFLYLNKFFPRKIFLKRAKMAADWIVEKSVMSNGGVRPRLYNNGNTGMYSFSSGNSFTFDTGMALNGIAMLFNETKDSCLVAPIEKISSFLLKMQNADGSINAYASRDKKMNSFDKWSNQPSSFHSKLAISLIESGKILNNQTIMEAASKICEKSFDYMKNTRFVTNKKTGFSETHPYCYSAEGLLYAGIELKNKKYISAAASSVNNLLTRIDPTVPCIFDDNRSLYRTRSDTVAQLLRLSLILKNYNIMNVSDSKLKKLYELLETFQIMSGNQKGGFAYGTDHDGTELNHANSWAAMFSIQALIMYKEHMDGKTIDIKPFV